MMVSGNRVDHANVGVIVFGVTCAMRSMIRRRGRDTGILNLVSHRVVLLWSGITQVMELILSGVLGIYGWQSAA